MFRTHNNSPKVKPRAPIGLIVFGLAFLIVVLVAPFSVKKEIEEDQNTSLAIIIGALIIGIAMIIAAAIQGN